MTKLTNQKCTHNNDMTKLNTNIQMYTDTAVKSSFWGQCTTVMKDIFKW